jgi:hypothetical protein
MGRFEPQRRDSSLQPDNQRRLYRRQGYLAAIGPLEAPLSRSPQGAEKDHWPVRPLLNGRCSLLSGAICNLPVPDRGKPSWLGQVPY